MGWDKGDGELQAEGAPVTKAHVPICGSLRLLGHLKSFLRSMRVRTAWRGQTLIPATIGSVDIASTILVDSR